MLRSMTGFGRAEGLVNEKKVTVEVRSLNSKQLDLLLKLPPPFREKEAEMRQLAAELIMRGKAEVFMVCEGAGSSRRSSFDKELIAAYHGELRNIVDGIEPGATTDLWALVLRMPDVLTTTREEVLPEEWQGTEELMKEALGSFDAFRKAEGEKLYQDLAQRVQRIEQLLEEVGALDQGRTERTRERLHTKLADLHVKVDQERFEQELTYYLEKLDINEEKMRLRTHCRYFMDTMDREEQQGRKLGFIGQEMGREINTLGSKANDAAIQKLVVQMKDELEKVKEQVLNVL